MHARSLLIFASAALGPAMPPSATGPASALWVRDVARDTSHRDWQLALLTNSLTTLGDAHAPEHRDATPVRISPDHYLYGSKMRLGCADHRLIAQACASSSHPLHQALVRKKTRYLCQGCGMSFRSPAEVARARTRTS